MTNYEKKKEELREQAIEWQREFTEQDYCYGDLLVYQDYFYTQGKKYGLLREFHENGIC